MRKCQQADYVRVLIDALRTAGLPTSPTVHFSFRPSFTRAQIAESRIFVAPSSSETERISRKRFTESPVVEVALARAIPVGEADETGLVDLDPHSLTGMYDLQHKLLEVLWNVPGVMDVEPTTGADNDFAADAIWFTVHKVTFAGF